MVRSSLPSASGVPTPVGQKNAPMPAPAARIRSARLPCGHDLELDPAGAVEVVEDPRVALSRERADDLADVAGLRAAPRDRGRRCRRCCSRRSGPSRRAGAARRSAPPAGPPYRTRRSARSRRRGCRRPRHRRRPPSRVRRSPAVPVRDVLQHHGEALAHTDADRGHAPAVVALAQHLGQACRGSGHQTRREGDRWRWRHRGCSRSRDRCPRRRGRPVTAPRRLRSAPRRRRRTSRCQRGPVPSRPPRPARSRTVAARGRGRRDRRCGRPGTGRAVRRPSRTRAGRPRRRRSVARHCPR